MYYTPASNTTPTKNSPFMGKKNELSNLLSLDAGARVLFATDEWFAIADNLLKDGPPIFIPNLYCREVCMIYYNIFRYSIKKFNHMILNKQGKVMDGWETRRKRCAGHDWSILKLAGKGGFLYGIEIDTAHFTGNQAPRVSILATNYKDYMSYDNDNNNNNSKSNELSAYTWMPGALIRLAKGTGQQGTSETVERVMQAEEACKTLPWTEILPMTLLQPGYEETRMHYFILPEEIQRQDITHVRVNLFPDGGIARIRLWGYTRSQDDIISPPPPLLNTTMILQQPYHHPEVSLSTNGGIGLLCSNKHYGVPQNLIQPTQGRDMGDGWETARHPQRPAVIIKDPITDLVDSPLMDWAILQLGMGGILGGYEGGISRIIIDTKHFRGNYPESVKIEGCYAEDRTLSSIDDSTYFENVSWFVLIPRSRLGPDQEHVYDREQKQIMNDTKDVSHVRVSIYPDGGISRIRIYGTPRYPLS